ncbi:MAG: hypothetical protein K5872_22145 [Rhizobiaceae bacterium]|nr:hypothetical protein [Rhizobiaceae bacterium]MCV0408922.1 hypothetical protein [Rhizobiaceae bacterium]
MDEPPVPTLRAIGAALRDGWSDRGFTETFDRDVMRLVESGRDWRALLPTHHQEKRYADAARSGRL